MTLFQSYNCFFITTFVRFFSLLHFKFCFSVNNIDFNKQESGDRYSMLNIVDLNTTIDSLVIKRKRDYKVITEKMHNRSSAKSLNKNINPILFGTEYKGNNVYNLFKLTKQKQLYDLGISSINSTISILKSNILIQDKREININKHYMSLHDKFALSLTCIILF